MEILKRAKGFQDGDTVAWNENINVVREEVKRRASKAGYCTSNGEPVHSTKIMTTVPFGKEKLNIWPRDKNGKLIE